MTNLKEKLKDVPKSPGVYEFKNKNGEVIYVGKAKNLKARVSQYFAGRDERDQIPYLMEEAADLAYTVVNNELESLFLESTLIRKYLPKYNIMLRDDKNYAFIKIDYSFEIPQIVISRHLTNTNIKYPMSNSQDTPKRKIGNWKLGIGNSKYFGPYTAAYKIRNTLNLIRRIFPYCSAQKVSGRPCFYYYLHRCPGVCIGKISLAEYQKQLEKIEDFLSGNVSKIKRELSAEMKIASARREFEKAAKLRDQCSALELLEERQTVILPKKVDWDIVSLASDQGYACVNLFKVREGKLRDKENFVYELIDPNLLIHPNNPNLNLSKSHNLEMDNSDHSPARHRPAQAVAGGPARHRPAQAVAGGDTIRKFGSVLQAFLEQYYLETSGVPKIVYTQMPASDSELVEHIIGSRFSRKTKVLYPQKGKPAELAKLGIANAQEYLKQWLQSQAGHLDKINNALAGLKSALSLEKIPERIECYDISNIQGTNAVGSMVVFNKGLPAKSEYRKFKIRSKSTPDDFSMMKEMLARRMSRIPNKIPKSKFQNQKSPWPIPDLIVIDGGKGQLSAALEVLQKFAIPVIGLAKRIEEIFVPGKKDPIILPMDNSALQMLQRLRDEAHRFGITYHRDLRSKQAVKSALDNIPGIGPKTKKLLKEKFGTVAQIRKTPFDDLAAVVGERIAQLIQQTL